MMAFEGHHLLLSPSLPTQPRNKHNVMYYDCTLHTCTWDTKIMLVIGGLFFLKGVIGRLYNVMVTEVMETVTLLNILCLTINSIKLTAIILS